MMTRRNVIRGGTAVAGGLLALSYFGGSAFADKEVFEVTHTDAELRKILSPAAYKVMRHEGTEYPGTSPLDREERKGAYSCAGCDLPLIASETKFHSCTGWPSFWKPLDKAVASKVDRMLGMERTEVHCRRCSGHLGHVFNDGPKPTGLRYCMNGVSLKFKAA